MLNISSCIFSYYTDRKKICTAAAVNFECLQTILGNHLSSIYCFIITQEWFILNVKFFESLSHSTIYGVRCALFAIDTLYQWITYQPPYVVSMSFICSTKLYSAIYLITSTFYFKANTMRLDNTISGQTKSVTLAKCTSSSHCISSST